MHTRALHLFLTVIFTATAALAQQAGGKPAGQMPPVTSLSLPGRDWSVVINTEGFTLKQRGEKPGGQGVMFMATNEKTGVVMSAYLVRAPKAGNSRDVREYYWGYESKGPLKVEDMKMSDLGEMPLLEYTIRRARGVQIEQKYYRGFLAKDDVWFDIRLSKVKFRPGEEELFLPTLRSIKIKSGAVAP